MTIAGIVLLYLLVLWKEAHRDSSSADLVLGGDVGTLMILPACCWWRFGDQLGTQNLPQSPTFSQTFTHDTFFKLSYVASKISHAISLPPEKES